MTNKEWSTTISAPTEYAVQFMEGYFETIDGEYKGLPSRRDVNEEWGSGYSTYSASDHAIPKRLVVTWYSYREDTFFHGDFALDTTVIAAGFDETAIPPYGDTINTKRYLTVGVAPQGFVVVWLGEENHEWVVFTGKAVEVEGIPWKEVVDAPEFSKEEVLTAIVEDNLNDAKDSPHVNDPTYWQRLHAKQYHYDIVIEGAYTPYSISSYFYDKTMHKYFSDNTNFTQKPLSIVKTIRFAYFFPDHGPVVSLEDIDFDEFEQAMQTLTNQNHGDVRVVVSVTGDLSGWAFDVDMRIENDKNRIPIKNFTFERTDNTEYMEKVKADKRKMRYMNQWDKPATP